MTNIPFIYYLLCNAECNYPRSYAGAYACYIMTEEHKRADNVRFLIQSSIDAEEA